MKKLFATLTPGKVVFTLILRAIPVTNYEEKTRKCVVFQTILSMKTYTHSQY